MGLLKYDKVAYHVEHVMRATTLSVARIACMTLDYADHYTPLLLASLETNDDAHRGNEGLLKMINEAEELAAFRGEMRLRYRMKFDE